MPLFFNLIFQFLFCELFRPLGIDVFGYLFQFRCNIDVRRRSAFECALDTHASGRGLDAQLVD